LDFLVFEILQPNNEKKRAIEWNFRIIFLSAGIA
jgi:hypothetical protein